MKKGVEMCKRTVDEAEQEWRTLLELTLDASANEETILQAKENTLLWEDLLGGQSADVISTSTCCKAAEFPTLACQEVRNGKAPKLVPWKCTHATTCNDWGVEKEMRIADCPALLSSAESMLAK